MRIKPSQSAQRSLTTLYWKEARKVLLEISKPVLAAADNTTPQGLKNKVDQLLSPEKMEKYLNELWVKVGGKFAHDTERLIVKRKSLEEPRIDEWEEGFRMYAADRSKQIAKKIIQTQADYIKIAIDKVINDAQVTGEAISTISGAIKEEFAKDLIIMQRYEAERIARTEVIGASNKGSFDGAKASGLDMKKGWLHSGIYTPGYRQNHVDYETRGYINMDDEFAPGLQYPGDPNADPGEIINCRCTIIYSVD